MGAILWLVAAGVLALGELLVMDFTLLMLAVAALATSGVSALLGSPHTGIEIGVFALSALMSIMLIRPVIRRRLFHGDPQEDQFSYKSLLGKEAQALTVITDNDDGQVKVAGELWSARSYIKGQDIPADTELQVMDIDGNTLVVAPKVLS